jgi:hypothetical protein
VGLTVGQGGFENVGHAVPPVHWGSGLITSFSSWDNDPNMGGGECVVIKL